MHVTACSDYVPGETMKTSEIVQSDAGRNAARAVLGKRQWPVLRVLWLERNNNPPGERQQVQLLPGTNKTWSFFATWNTCGLPMTSCDLEFQPFLATAGRQAVSLKKLLPMYKLPIRAVTPFQPESSQFGSRITRTDCAQTWQGKDQRSRRCAAHSAEQRRMPGHARPLNVDKNDRLSWLLPPTGRQSGRHHKASSADSASA